MKLLKSITFFFICLFLFLTISISAIVYTSVDSTITNSSKQNIQREIEGIKYEFNTYINSVLYILNDYSKITIFTQSVMQPEVNKYIITDLINDLSFFGHNFQMYLLDFEGEIINKTKEKVNINFKKNAWVENIIEQKIKNHKKLIEKNKKYYWELAVPVVYNGLNEGLLVVHIPTSSFEIFSNISTRLDGMNIKLKYKDSMIESYGKSVTGNMFTKSIDKDMGNIVITVDSHGIDEERIVLFTKIIFSIIFFAIISILVSVFFMNKEIITPLHNFQNNLKSFFDFINKKTKEINTSENSSKNEIGEMTRVVNQNIIKAKTSIQKDRAMVSDIAKNLEKISDGKFDSKSHGDDLIFIMSELDAQSRKLSEFNITLEAKVNQGIEEIRKKDKLLEQQSKLASMGEMVGNIAHQWRQPLNALAGNIQFLKEDYEDGIIDEAFLDDYIKQNMEFINFMSKTIDDFRDFFKTGKIKEPFNILESIDKPLNIVRGQFKLLNIHLDIRGEDFVINGIESEFQQVVLNIVNNAKDALLENKISNGLIIIKSIMKDNIGILTIQDNAGGIPTDIIDRVFEPYFTTKEEGKGTGIGLYMSKSIIENNMDAKLIVKNEGDGAKFEIKFKL
jgi:signal transduction histidine kinase